MLNLYQYNTAFFIQQKTKDESNPAPAPTEAETLAYFDSVIAAFDQGNKSRTHTAEAMHLDVDFVSKFVLVEIKAYLFSLLVEYRSAVDLQLPRSLSVIQ